MSTKKSERILNLLISMLSSRVPLSKHQIRELNEGYRGLNDTNFERMFERDKDELRAIGVVIRTEEMGYEWSGEVGYRVARSDYELPPLEFTREEMAVLGAASHVWQESVAAQETGEALGALRAAGVDVDPAQLMTLRPHIAGDPGFDTVRDALLERREVRFTYRGRDRVVQPWRLHMRRGHWYLLGLDVERGEPRHFKLKRVESGITQGRKPHAYEVPPLDQMPSDDFGAEDATATVVLHDDVATDLRRLGEPVLTEHGLPDGFRAWRVAMPNPELLVSEVCALGEAALVLEPRDVRDRVIAQLTWLAERWQR